VSLAYHLFQMGEQVGLVTNGRDAAERIRKRGWEHDFRTRAEALRNAEGEEPRDRLQPLLVETRRGPEQFQRIREVLARVELNDGLTMDQLLIETAPRMPRNATVVALLAQADPATVLALGNLRRRGFAVTAVLIVFTHQALDDAQLRLQAENIDVQTLNSELELTSLAERPVLRS
jgi:hypothetical protein